MRIVFRFRGVIDTAESKIGHFTVEYFREFEAIFKKTFTRLLWAQGKFF
jgi:hypothetical protein